MGEEKRPVIYVCTGEDEDEYPFDKLVDWFEKFLVISFRDLQRNPGLSKEVQGMVVTPKPPVLEEARNMIPQLANLKAIASLASGYETAYMALKQYGIPFANCPNAHTDAVADHGMALLLSAGCGMLSGLRNTIFADVPSCLPFSYRSPGVCGSTLGILGMGYIGSAIAQRARAFQMTIFYHNRTRRSEEHESTLGATFHPSLDEMLPLCDYIMVSCNLSDQTRGIIGEKQFRRMKSTAVLVNISRGKTVDTDALVDALTTGRIAYAALDVTDPEPLPPGHPLLALNNVVITPHSAFATTRGVRNCFLKTNSNLEAALIEKTKMPNEVNG